MELNNWAETPGWSGTPQIVIWLHFLFEVTPVTRLLQIFNWLTNHCPFLLGITAAHMQGNIKNVLATSIERACITWAPREAYLELSHQKWSLLICGLPGPSVDRLCRCLWQSVYIFANVGFYRLGLSNSRKIRASAPRVVISLLPYPLITGHDKRSCLL